MDRLGWSALLAAFLLALYFLGLFTPFVFKTIMFIGFVLAGAMSMLLLPDDWKSHGLFTFVVGILFIAIT